MALSLWGEGGSLWEDYGLKVICLGVQFRGVRIVHLHHQLDGWWKPGNNVEKNLQVCPGGLI